MKIFNLDVPKDQTKDAFRLATQSSLSIVITYLAVQEFKVANIFLALLSAVLVVEPTIGDTIIQAKNRIIATLVGSIIAFFLVIVLPLHLETIISLAITMFVLNAIAAFKPSWRYGIVAAVAISLGAEQDAFEISLERLMAIGIGLGIGIVISLLVFPEKAETRAKKNIRRALSAASNRFETAVQNTRKGENKDLTSSAEKFHKNINAAERTANSISFGRKQPILNQIKTTRKLYNSILIIHRVAAHAENDVTNGNSGIEVDAEIVHEKASKILKALANQDKIEDSELEIFSDLVEKAKDHVVLNPDNKSVNMLRQTFVFGLTEIRDSISVLVKIIKK